MWVAIYHIGFGRARPVLTAPAAGSHNWRHAAVCHHRRRLVVVRRLASERPGYLQAHRLRARGLWADPNFALLTPENSVRLRAERGHFTIIEGKVLSVRDSGSTIYLNFGPRWTRDFSVIVLRRNQRIFNEAGLVLKRLEGRRVRVRGVLEQRRGPVIEADAPEQIEIADETMTHAQESQQDTRQETRP